MLLYFCTIDSFCGNLVRENFEQLGLSPDFRMLDETEVSVLQQAALEEVLEELYAEQDPDFLKLVELLATGRDDTSIEENILRLHTYSRAYPSPEHWLRNALTLYDEPSGAYRILKGSLQELIDSWVLKWENAIRQLQAERTPPDVSFDETITCIRGYIAELDTLTGLLTAEDWNGFLAAVDAISIPTLKKPKDPENKRKNYSSPALALAGKLKEDFTPGKLPAAFRKSALSDEADVAVDNALLKPLAEKLVECVLRFDEAYTLKKREENALDFADTELFALRLLVEDPAAEPFTRKELAETLRKQYKEILIDEYQDTNKLQDTIFAALSNDDLFMVGDVKQSIYRFRQAMPELFLAKKEQYPLYDTEKDEYPATVILGSNFRSRAGVLHGVNYTFSRLMSKAVAEITYDEQERLNFGAKDAYEDRAEPDVEFHIVTPEAGADKKEAEAKHIARYIANTIRDSQGTENPLTFRDFAILLRSTKNTANLYRKALSEAGIPVYAEQGGGFLETPEVMTMLSFLSVIDNPVQDVPLLAVLLSPLFGFTEDEVASLRIGSRYTNLYKAVLAAEERGDAHCASFLDALRGFRTLSVSMGAGELLRRIYEETSYDAIVRAMPLGEQRIANLQMLLQYADSYDANSSYGLSGFVRYMDRLSEQDSSLNVAATLSPNANVVQIMSIHKSKGLEFRVCIVADLNHQFNDSDLRRKLILHPELGIGLQGRQPDTGFTYPTLCHSAIREASLRSDRSEALRVLYVAMTRARETLVLTACDAPDKNSTKDSLASSIASAAGKLYGGDVVPPMEVLRCNSFYQWVLLAFLQHPDAKLLRARDAEGPVALLPLVDNDEAAPVVFTIDDGSEEADTEDTASTAAEDVPTDAALVAELKERMTWEYPHAALAASLSKRSASHLAEKPFSTEFFAESRPESLSRLGMTPAERGTCLHKFMQYADFALAEEDAETEKQRLVDRGFLLPDEAAVIDPEQVRAFFASSIAERMKKSPRVLREHKFAILLPAGQFDDSLTGTDAKEEVLIQGIIDCAFEEAGSMILLDYKTDRVTNGEELADRYRDQLDLYRVALEETLGLPVREVSLWSFHLGEEVRL
jgi:ATP-dependent helicase/nuclease subunit A